MQLDLAHALTMFFWLLVGHAVADYPLQGDFLARAKNRKHPIPGVPWVHGLFWHALIHAGFVAFITNSPWFLVAELAGHMAIDDMKCMSDTGVPDGFLFHFDQLAHVFMKAFFVAVLYGIGR